MALAPRLDLRQSQQLVMTPQLQQAIKLLQLTNMELSEFVIEEVEKNPLLELGGPEGGDDPNSDATTPGDSSDGGGERVNGEASEMETAPAAEYGADQALENAVDSTASADAPLDTDYGENVFNSDSGSDAAGSNQANEQLGYSGAGTIRGAGGPIDTRSLDERFGDVVSLKDYLSEQLRIIPLDPQDHMISNYLIEILDDAGYLGPEYWEAAERLGCDPEDVERVLEVLQGLEPIGIFARDLAECLTLQLKELNRFDPCMEALVEHLDLLGKRDFVALKRVCKVDKEDLAEMILEIQALNPKPGLTLSGAEPVQTVVPDVFVRRSPAGTWSIELNSETLPRVLINSHYCSEISELGGSKEDKAFISDCLSNANWLVKALDQRARTILKVSTELVRQQEEFFINGVRSLKPLNLKAIAEAIEMHESTVSRVTSNKYMATPRGIFELKYFFTSAIASAGDGEAHSAEAVRDRIRELIEDEQTVAVLSDDKIVDMLAGDGVDIARRTVAKYREAMGIPSSVQRRRQKKMFG